MCSKPYNWNEAIRHLQEGIDNEINEKSTIARSLHEDTNGADNYKIKTINCMECATPLAYYFVNSGRDDDCSSHNPVLCYLCAISFARVADLLDSPICSVLEVEALWNRLGHDISNPNNPIWRWHAAIIDSTYQFEQYKKSLNKK